ncbi:penicillin-binding protein activator [Halioglobus sp. Uisw_031]|uniref:penicillin-binding protein activator n=1 Tax=Halioglobus sp. Uisw_031 TaxID=3230977 RepID=UPI0039E7C2B6
MTERHSSQRSQVSVLTLLLLTLLLWGCSGNPQKKEPQPKTSAPEKQQPIQQSEISLALPHSQFSAVLNSAEQSLAEFDWMQASVALQEMPVDGLSSNDDTYVGYLQARIAYIRGDQLQALEQLEQLNYPGINPALHYRILSFKHYILETQGDSLASAQLADQILRGTQADTAAAWKRSVWQNLERTNKQQLLTAFPNAADPQWRGWLALALINRQTDSEMQRELVQWRTENPGHPAANPLPGGLDYLLASSSQSGKVALILPLSGQLAQAGKAVLDGFLAAHYADSSAGQATNEILVIDVGEFPSASNAYGEALREGASIVVGPLSKEALADLATRPERPIPILALNRIHPILPAQGSALVQLSLAPEDEAISVAELAFGRGARRAIIITPAGDWGNKVETALRERWASLGGTIASNTTYSTYDDYSSSVTSALSLDVSEQRASDLRATIGINIEFTPRRRQDADAIFLLSHNGAEARSIKPLLAFHYAGDLPVYAISNIYNGIPDERNQDLNGIQLVETPWLLGANPDLLAALATGGVKSGNYTRLNALGADAYLVQSNFLRLQSGADALMRGNTGLLSMDPTLSIKRQLSPATFDAGVLKAQ